MKRLALLLPAMRMGGAERIGLNLLEDLIQYYDVTVILNRKEGELLNRIPADVIVIEDSLRSFHEIFQEDIKKRNLTGLLKDIRYYIKVKLKIDTENNYRYLINRTPPLQLHFDCAIGYVANVSTQIFSLADRVNADKKIAWIHGETTNLKNTRLYESCYRRFDKIFTVSQVSRTHFIERFPACASITDVYYNPIKREEILEKSKVTIHDVVFEPSVTNIVTVGRISPEKGFDMIPEIVRLLSEYAYKIHWYIIGDGPSADTVRENSRKNGTENAVFLLGNRMNPYPYIKNCDIYVQPSYEEGYSTTICEAGILGKAIIGTTTSGGIREQISDGVSGLLAEPEPQALTAAIVYLLDHPQKKTELETNIKSADFFHTQEIEKLLSIF